MRPEVGLELQGRYQLVERIAVGGMGEVWKATDLRSGRAVAAKILRHELTGDEIFLSRLRAEARNSRGLRHPNLAVVLDSGERDGSGWIIMELVQGRALSEIISEQGTMPPADILPVLAQVARALQVVHDSGVVHRDVKPSNILINREGLAKLTDFGISTGVHQRPLTATGMVMGTAQYLAPEQAMGNMATPAGDLYALGVIGYEALVGRRPFTGATQVDIAFAHVNQDVPPMPDSVPPEVRKIIMELLEKRPEARPRSAREVARRLDRIVVNLPAESWDPREAPTWTATGRAPAATASAGTLGTTASSPAPAQVVPGDAVAAAARTACAEAGSRATSRTGRRAGARTRSIPAVSRTSTARPTTASTGRHSSDRGLLGLRLETWSRIVLAIVTVLVLALCLGTLAQARAVMDDGVLTSTTPLKEAL
ncbi:serine/threonine-protein kinase [Actinomyces sp. W5033]|uniref:serine/threonine-protein kinase n=1 Tax=Actinomyces sp. W5033 TaxID=3446479 RepID=UPI003EDFFCBB